jgi:putative phosphoesterase
MLVVLSDTHGRETARLSGRTAEAVAAASMLVHAGDFVTTDVLEAFEAHAPVYGVAGNSDTAELRERVPRERVVEWRALDIAVVHGHEHTDTALSMVGRQAGADLVVAGHSHEPGFREGSVPILNPGSHADPRWNRPAHAELEWDEDEAVARGRLVEPSGTVFERFVVEPRAVD